MNKHYRPQRTHITEQWQLLTVSKAEGICMLSETKISAADWGGGEVIFFLYSKHFHKLHGLKYETSF